MRISCVHFSDSFRLKGKSFMGQASHKNEEERESIKLKDRVETSWDLPITLWDKSIVLCIAMPFIPLH